MEELRKINKLIILVVFFILSCTTTNKSVNYKDIHRVKLTFPNNNIMYLEERDLNNFMFDFNNKNKYKTSKNILFLYELQITFNDGKTLDYKVSNGGNLLSDGKEIWDIKTDLLLKYWELNEENRSFFPVIKKEIK
jgi:hypothetical protein